MTQLLPKAFEKATQLPQEEQDKFARFMLAELESEQRWAELFSRPESEDLLERLADDALAAHRAGRTQPLNTEELRLQRTVVHVRKHSRPPVADPQPRSYPICSRSFQKFFDGYSLAADQKCLSGQECFGKSRHAGQMMGRAAAFDFECGDSVSLFQHKIDFGIFFSPVRDLDMRAPGGVEQMCTDGGFDQAAPEFPVGLRLVE